MYLRQDIKKISNEVRAWLSLTAGLKEMGRPLKQHWWSDSPPKPSWVCATRSKSEVYFFGWRGGSERKIKGTRVFRLVWRQSVIITCRINLFLLAERILQGTKLLLTFPPHTAMGFLQIMIRTLPFPWNKHPLKTVLPTGYWVVQQKSIHSIVKSLNPSHLWPGVLESKIGHARWVRGIKHSLSLFPVNQSDLSQS